MADHCHHDFRSDRRLVFALMMTRRLLRLLLLTGLILPAACAGAPERPCAEPDGPAMKTLHVVRHRWHTGLVIRRENAGALAFLDEHFREDQGHYEIGWGDKGFYQAPDITAGVTLKALFWPSDTVMHVAAQPRPPAEYPHTDLLTLRVPAADHERLTRAIADSFHRDDDGQVVATREGLYDESHFFRARGTFWFANTCNSWTARMLDEAGVPVRTFMALTAGGLMDQLRDALADGEVCGAGD